MAFAQTCGFVLHNEQVDSRLEIHPPDRLVKIAFIFTYLHIQFLVWIAGVKNERLTKKLDEDRKKLGEQQVRLRDGVCLFSSKAGQKIELWGCHGETGQAGTHNGGSWSWFCSKSGQDL